MSVFVAAIEGNLLMKTFTQVVENLSVIIVESMECFVDGKTVVTLHSFTMARIVSSPIDALSVDIKKLKSL